MKQDNLEHTRETAMRFTDEEIRLHRAVDYWRVPFKRPVPPDLLALSIMATRKARVARRVAAWYETGALFYNARDFR